MNKRVLPVLIGGVKSMRESPFAAWHVIDYRIPSENTAIRLIEDVRQTRRKPLPDPLPPEPPGPYAYLMQMKSDITDPQLIPQEQLQLLLELKARLNEEAADPAPRADIASQLYALRDRSDTTAETRAEIDAMVESLDLKRPHDRIGERGAGAQLSSSVFAPPAVEPGATFLVQVFAHLPEHEAQAATQAREFDDEAKPRATVRLELPVFEGERLAFELLLPGLLVDDPVQRMAWIDSPQSVQFGVSVPRNFPPRTVIGTVRISRDSVPVGHLKFKLSVCEPGSVPSGKCAPSPEMHRYNRAFISYASADRNEVLKRTQMLAVNGIEFFQDILTFNPGERWERRLYLEIGRSDVFYLFWSSAAKKSTYVIKEVQYALKCNGGNELAPPEIVPVIIEPVEAPPELAHLHFNDRMIYFMQPKRTNWFSRRWRRSR